MRFNKEHFLKYAPTKRILIPLAVVLVVGGGIMLVKERGLPFFSKKDNLAGVTVKQLVEKDTDADGLKDWEETLWGMDVDNPDTDGDGILDGEEVREERALIAKETGIDTNNEGLSPSEILSRDIYITLAALKESGNLNEKSVKNLSTQVAEFVKNTNKPKVRTASDLRIVPTTNETLIKYIKDINVAFTERKISSRDPITELTAYLNTEDTSYLSEIASIQKSYEVHQLALLQMEVPSEAESLQLSLVNSLEGMIQGLKLMKATNIESMGAMAGLSFYSESLTTYQSGLNDLVAFIKRKSGM